MSLCGQYPGFSTDLTLTGPLAVLYRVDLGKLTLPEAVRDRSIRVEGPTALASRLPTWLGTSRFAGP